VVLKAAGWPVLGAMPPLAVAWYAAEALLAYAAGWPFSLRSIATWMLRTRWIAAWIGSDFEWRGNAMTIADQGRSA
jgi:ceramide glucosyltransferase